jgi:hypothetical protein
VVNIDDFEALGDKAKLFSRNVDPGTAGAYQGSLVMVQGMCSEGMAGMACFRERTKIVCYTSPVFQMPVIGTIIGGALPFVGARKDRF